MKRRWTVHQPAASTIVKSLHLEENQPELTSAPFENSMGAYFRHEKSLIPSDCLTPSLRETAFVLVEELGSTSHNTSSFTVLAKRCLPTSCLLALKDPLKDPLSRNCLSTRSNVCRFGVFLLGNRPLYNLCASVPFPFAASYN